MKPQINIAELLEDCPKGMELYSPLCGKCVFDRLNFGTIICKKQNTQEITFTSKGYYMLPVFDDCECMIFPSKDQRDWSKFVPPYKFKDGDVLVHTQNGRFIMSIYKSNENEKLINTHVIFWDREEGLSVGMQICCYTDNVRFATKEEKAKLFKAIKDNGYKWNPETKTLDKLPKFKVGDKIVKKNSGCVPFVIMGVSDDYYYSNTESSVEVLPIAEQDNWELVSNIEPKFKVGDRIRSIISNSGYIYNVIEIKESLYVVSKNDENDNKLIDFKIQDCWELVPNKFDITTLKPFDKVLVRGGVGQKWAHDFFGFMDKGFPFVCVGYYVSQCIPFEGNEHLLGTTDDCDEYYKTWEK